MDPDQNNTDAPVEVIESRPARIRCGGCRPVTDFKEVEDKLNNSLTKLAAGDGPNYKFVFNPTSFRLGKVYSATQQMVSGSMQRIVAELITEDGMTKRFNISIWSQSWLPDGIEITLECEGEPMVVKKHSP